LVDIFVLIPSCPRLLYHGAKGVKSHYFEATVLKPTWSDPES
jgi:hypothetical protein